MSEISLVAARLDEYSELVNAALEQYVPQSELKQKAIFSACRYTLLNGGKRIRPALLMEFYRLCGGKVEDALPFACALEMIHTYSLIHDDLPAMDNDDMRRGKPSSHKAFGEGLAILAGDSLLNCAFETMLNNVPHSVSLQNAVAAMREMANCSGMHGMIGGQVIDTGYGDADVLDADRLTHMIDLKTGALLHAACVCGCLLAGAEQKQINAAGDYALAIGRAFQIKDDVLDVTGDEKKLGKAIGSDAENEKYTFISAYGISKCEILVEEYTKKAVCAADAFSDNKFIKELAEYLARRDS